jgi:hypothetical protein
MPWARMILFARVNLGLTEKEFWKLSLRKYCALRDEWKALNTPQEEQLA